LAYVVSGSINVSWQAGMPRKPRFYLPGVPVHAVQRGHSRQAVFFEDADYQVYLHWLRVAAQRYDCSVHAYVLMTNHIHLLLTPQSEDSLARLMQYLGRHYVPYINRRHCRSGTLWEGRYKASLVQQELYLFRCYHYIELNPVRAGMVEEPGGYRWSSHAANAEACPDPVITPHPLYLELGRTQAERCRRYRSMFPAQLGAAQLALIRSACQSGTPLGTDRFRCRIEARLGCATGYARRGRPAEKGEKGL
jgi:putative transposase